MSCSSITRFSLSAAAGAALGFVASALYKPAKSARRRRSLANETVRGLSARGFNHFSLVYGTMSEYFAGSPVRFSAQQRLISGAVREVTGSLRRTGMLVEAKLDANSRDESSGAAQNDFSFILSSPSSAVYSTRKELMAS